MPGDVLPGDQARETPANGGAECELVQRAGRLIAWWLAGNHRFFHRWWGRESPFNRFLNLCGSALKADPRTLNATNLLFCGQFAFLAQAP